MDYVILGIVLPAAMVWIFGSIGSRLLRRYQRNTVPNCNAPNGRETDWRRFFGRR